MKDSRKGKTLNPTRKPDRRVLKTKRAIRNAFVKLLGEKNYADVTIKDIAINRKTFYYYYTGVHELIDEIENEFMASLEKLISSDEQLDLKNPHTLLEKLTIAIGDNFEFFGLLMKAGNRENSGIIPKITETLKRLVSTRMTAAGVEKKSADFIADYCVPGLVEVFRIWFNSDGRVSLEKLSDDLAEVMFGGLDGFIDAHRDTAAFRSPTTRV